HDLLAFHCSTMRNNVSHYIESKKPVKFFLVPFPPFIVLLESSEKLLHALLITQISKDDYADFHDFLKCFVPV
ncbi:MAG: hypothetical protein MUP27_06665, partial [Desulfobacterales bacterium]|nr:hypothetical protein [Desulfobacterales bacterium]